MKLKHLLLGLLLAATSVKAQELVAQKANNSGSWKIDINGQANVLVGSNKINGGLDGVDVAVDRPFIIIRVTSPNGKIEFEGVFNTQALLAREHGIDGVIPEHVVQELKAKMQINPMLSVSAGYGSVEVGAGLQNRGPRDVNPLISEQARYIEIRDRLMAEVGITLQTGTTIQLAVFGGRQADPVNPDGGIRGSDFINLRSADSLVDSVSMAATVKQHFANVFGFDVNIIGSYAMIRSPQAGLDDEHRMALALQIQRDIGKWTLGAMYQFVKVWGSTDVVSHLVEVTAKHGKLTLFARFDSTTESTNAGENRTREVQVGASYLAYKNSLFSVEPFAVFSAKKRNGEDVDWGAYLGVKVGFGYRFGDDDIRSE